MIRIVRDAVVGTLTGTIVVVAVWFALNVVRTILY